MKGLTPSARKIAYFRKDNPTAFKQAFRHFVGMLKDIGLIDGHTIAIDSFKIRAQNSQKNNFNQKKIDRHLDYIDDKIDQYQQARDQADQADLQQEIHRKIQHQEDKKNHFKSIERQLHESGQSQISLNDPDARSVILHRNITNVGYCLQTGYDGKHKLFTNNDTGTVNDTHSLASMAIDAKNLLGTGTMNVLADKGVCLPLVISRQRQEAASSPAAPRTASAPTARPRRAPNRTTTSSGSAPSPTTQKPIPTPAPTAPPSAARATSTRKTTT